MLLNSAMYDHAPQLVAAHRARGDEIAGHGRTNSERQSILPEAEERALIAESTAAIARHEGRAAARLALPLDRREPDDARSCWPRPATRYTLNWCMDDQPIWMATEAGRLLAIPYPQEVNDIPAMVARKDGAEQFAAMVLADFEERLDQVGRDGIPQVMGIALHPYIIGQPYRLRALRGALAAIAARRGRGLDHHRGRGLRPCRHAAGGDGAMMKCGLVLGTLLLGACVGPPGCRHAAAGRRGRGAALSRRLARGRPAADVGAGFLLASPARTRWRPIPRGRMGGSAC